VFELGKGTNPRQGSNRGPGHAITLSAASLTSSPRPVLGARRSRWRAEAASVRSTKHGRGFGQDKFGPMVDVLLWKRDQVDGYRVNNALDQRNDVGDLRYTTPDFSAYFNLSGDDQHLRLPGPRTVDPSLGSSSSSPTEEVPIRPSTTAQPKC